MTHSEQFVCVGSMLLQGLPIPGSRRSSPTWGGMVLAGPANDFGKFIADESEVIRAANIKPE